MDSSMAYRAKNFLNQTKIFLDILASSWQENNKLASVRRSQAAFGGNSTIEFLSIF